MTRERIEQLLRGQPVIWSRIHKCGKEPALMETLPQLKFKIMYQICHTYPESMKQFLPKDLYEDLCDLVSVLLWVQFLSSDDQRILNVLQCGISEGARWCKLPRSTYYLRVQSALDRLSDLLVNL